MFEWIRDEYRLRKEPSRHQRAVDAVNGDTWYKNYQIKECQCSNKSSFCNGQHAKYEQETKHAPEISELFEELDRKDQPSDGGKLQAQTHHTDSDIVDGENVKLQLLPTVTDHRELSGSNYSPIEARLSAKKFLARQQNAVHEIEMKHRHLAGDSDDDGRAPSNEMLSDNQLPASPVDTSSNSNFPFTFNLDTSSSDSKRSSGQQQKQRQHFDDQLSQKKNDLFDEVDEKLSKSEQQGLQTLHRVKRREIDVNEINRLMTNGEMNYEELFKSKDEGDGESN